VHAQPDVERGCTQCAGTGSVTYAVYRSTASGFTPELASRIAAGLTGTSYSDTADLASGTTYYYVVRATDTATAWRTQMSCNRLACPTDRRQHVPLHRELRRLGRRQPGRLARGYFSGNANDWRGVMTCTAHSGAKILRYGGAGCAAAYAQANHALALPPALTISAAATNVRLSFWHQWDFYRSGTSRDGAYLRISFDGRPSPT